MPMPNYKLIPRSTIEALERYIEHHIPTGGFLEAVLSNDLCQAFARADEHNCVNLFHIAAYCYNELPRNSWGSPEKVAEWLKYRQGC